MADHVDSTAPHFTIATTPAADAAAQIARDTFAAMATDLRRIREQAKQIAVSLAAHQPADPVREAIDEGRLPSTPARDLYTAAELFVEDAIGPAIDLADTGATVTAGKVAEDFSRRQLDGMAAEHRQMRREHGE